MYSGIKCLGCLCSWSQGLWGGWRQALIYFIYECFLGSQLGRNCLHKVWLNWSLGMERWGRGWELGMRLSKPRVSQQNQQVLHLGLSSLWGVWMMKLLGLSVLQGGNWFLSLLQAYPEDLEVDRSTAHLLAFPRMLACSAADLCSFFLLQWVIWALPSVPVCRLPPSLLWACICSQIWIVAAKVSLFPVWTVGYKVLLSAGHHREDKLMWWRMWTGTRFYCWLTEWPSCHLYKGGGCRS